METKQRTTRDEHLTEVEGLYALAPEPLPFAPSLDIRAFLLRRDRGNVLIYSTTSLRADTPAATEAGGIARHYLNHSHEAMFASEHVGLPVFVHEAERAAVGGRYRIRGTFSRRHMLDEDFEVIPTPGHTPGATAYLWDSGEHRVLFTGDTLYLDDGRWVAAVLSSSDRDAYLRSLELLGGLDFDVLVPWAATRGQQPYTVTNPADARSRIAAIAERLRRGEDR